VGTISLLAAVSCLALFAGQEVPEPDLDYKLFDLVVMSSDQKIVEDFRKEFLYEMHAADLKERLDQPRLVFERWGNRGMIVIDREVPALAAQAHQRDLMQFLAEFAGPDQVVRASDVPPEKRPQFEQALDRYFPWHSRNDDFDMRQAALGIDIGTVLTVHSADQQKNFTVRQPREVTRRRNDAMAQHAMPQRSKPLTAAEDARRLREIRERVEREGQTVFHTFGAARGNLPQALREASRHIEELARQLEQERKVAADALLDKIGFGYSTKTLPNNRVGFENLPPDIRKQLLVDLEEGYENYGFASLDEAKRYLNSSDGIGVSLQIGLHRSLKSGDRDRFIPGTGSTYVFTLIRP
jgi:hypothetical protein